MRVPLCRCPLCRCFLRCVSGFRVAWKFRQAARPQRNGAVFGVWGSYPKGPWIETTLRYVFAHRVQRRYLKTFWVVNFKDLLAWRRWQLSGYACGRRAPAGILMVA